MAGFVKTRAFIDWIDGLTDGKGRVRILKRLRTFETTGHPGDAEPVGNGVCEMRIHVGPGYRVYDVVLSKTVILLGGDKSTQKRDIKIAKEFASYWKGQKP